MSRLVLRHLIGVDEEIFPGNPEFPDQLVFQKMIQDREQNPLFASEMPLDRGAIGLGAFHNLGDGSLMIALGGEEAEGNLQDPLAGFLSQGPLWLG